MNDMKTSDLLLELDDVIFKLKMRVLYYQTENKQLRKKIEELKKYVKEK
tara:strand:- start:985 stop:1131 length:147 start_codon:yes stop_codon:yes gene_type:complete